MIIIAQKEALDAGEELIKAQVAQIAAADYLIREHEAVIIELESIIAELVL